VISTRPFWSLCLGWSLLSTLAAPSVAGADSSAVSRGRPEGVAPGSALAFGPPPATTRAGTAPASNDASASSGPATAGPPTSTAVPSPPAAPPAGAYPPGYPQAAPGYPPANYPPPSYPPGNYPAPSYPPGGYPPPSYPPSGYPPSVAPPGYYPYAQPGYPPGYYYPAPPPRPRAPTLRPPGARTHDGLYVRMQFGLSALDLQGTIPGTTVTYGGVGVSGGAAIGYTLAPHLTLYLDLLVSTATGTTTHVNGLNQYDGQRGVAFVGMGPGLSFDFGPNLFAAATLLLAGVEVDDSNGNALADSKSGAAVELQLGKEWWVSDNWGIGLAGQFIYGSMRGSDPDPTLLAVPDWRFLSFAILFSATYN